ncbi:MAG TPA: choice-of-anchor D domain-containing protein, partial [Gemmatimonadaceae bacterium]|nr:choice-of-anchor D domain-containing protein [Gemmatimonadaceae bacterium]
MSGKGVTATTLSTTSLVFGNVVQGSPSKVKKFKLTNNQDVQLTGLTFTSSSPDFSATGCGATLAAHATCTESVTFTPTAAPGTTETGTLTITHSAVTSPQSVAMTGKSVLPLSLAPASLVFSSTAQGATRTLSTLKLTNNQKVSLTNISYALTGPFTATGCTPPLGAGKNCTLSVTFAPTASHIGLVTGSLTVSSTNPTAWNHPVASLSGTAIVAVSLTPTPLAFGDITVAATSAAKSLVVKNNLSRSIALGASPFTIDGANAADFARTTTTCGTSLAAGASCSVNLTFHPHAGGPRVATFKVASDAPGSPHGAALTGNGTTPITVSPTKLAFGNVGVGLASAAKLVTLQNNQDVAAPITVNPPTGDFTKEPATTCGTSLAPGASCTIAIAMKPKVGGAQAGQLTILEPPFAALNVPLSGTGINAITTSVSSLTFAAQKVGTTSISKQIIVTNHQNVPASLGTALTGNFAATDACGGIVPALATCVVSVTFTPLSVASLTGGITFDDHVTPTGRVAVKLSGTGTSSNPPASITSVSPGAGTVGTVVSNVAIAGSYTTFTDGPPTVSFGAGVTVSGVTVLSDTSLVVGSVSIAAGATPGARNVQVTNG